MKYCICQMIKDEQDYIEEWVEYHHNLGVERFFLIEDFGSTSHADILAKYSFVELYKFDEIISKRERKLLESGVYRQRVVYEIFRRKWRKDYDFLLFIDVDEFVDLTKEQLESLLQKGADYPCIYLRWKNMKCDGHLHHPNNGEKYSLIDTYNGYNYKISNFKCIVNCADRFKNTTTNKKFKWFPHMFDSDVNVLLDGSEIKHFLCKSLDEWVTRLSVKGEIERADWNRRIEDWFYTNTEYADNKNELMRLFGLDALKVKYNDYSKERL